MPSNLHQTTVRSHMGWLATVTLAALITMMWASPTLGNVAPADTNAANILDAPVLDGDQPLLTVLRTVRPAPEFGQLVELRVTNVGAASAFDVTLRDDWTADQNVPTTAVRNYAGAPLGSSPMDISDRGIIGGGIRIFDPANGAIPAGRDLTVTYLVGSSEDASGGHAVVTWTADEGGNQISRAASELPFTRGLASATTPADILAQTDVAALAIEQSLDQTQLEVGGRTVVTIKIHNTGTAPATNIIVADTYAPGLSHFSSDPAGNVKRSTISWVIPTLGAGERATLVATLRATTEGTLTNRVAARSEGLREVVTSTVIRVSGSGLTPSEDDSAANNAQSGDPLPQTGLNLTIGIVALLLIALGAGVVELADQIAAIGRALIPNPTLTPIRPRNLQGRPSPRSGQELQPGM